jgi:signal transduction histidine kinase/ActR/RegA family two-component response regulator
VALAAVLVATLSRLALERVFGAQFQLIAFFPAIVVSAWFGGMGPGLFATLLGGLAVLLLAHPAPWAVPGVGDLASLTWLLLVGGLVSGLTGALVRAKRRVERELHARDETEKTLAALNDDLQRQIAEQDELLVREQAALAQAERRQREAELFAKLTRNINESLDFDRMLGLIASAAQRLCGSDVTRIALREPGSEVMAFRYAVGARDEGCEGVLLEPGKGAAGLVMATKRPFRTASAVDGPRASHSPLIREQESVAVMMVPIVIGERAEGLIYVDKRSARPFTDQDEASLLHLADHAAIAVKNAQLFAKEQAARAEAEATRAEAEASNRAKDEFLAMLGHELRNPLGAIRNAVPVLDSIGEQFGRVQEIIGRQTYHLARLLDDLLDVSRLAAGKLVIERRSVDLREVAERSLASLTQEGKTEQHAIVLTGESTLVDGDPTRLEQVVRNLIDNAVKYTPPGGRITVTVGRDGAEALIRVSDTGVGIAADVLPHIFDSFVQAVPSPDQSKGGLGLGLSLVKRIVEVHDGTVSASSPGTNEGSEFVVRLPLAAKAPVGPDPAEVALSSPGSRQILVIEDDQGSRESLRLLLQTWGHRVAEAADGQSGLEMTLASSPEIVLIDIDLPDLDGYSVARAIRRVPAGKSAYLVAVTGYGQPEDRRRSLEAGFDAHLVKPVDPGELLKFLTKAGGGTP